MREHTDRQDVAAADVIDGIDAVAAGADRVVDTAATEVDIEQPERKAGRRWNLVADLGLIAMGAAGVALTVYRNPPEPDHRWLWSVGAGVVGVLLGLGARALRMRRYGS